MAIHHATIKRAEKVGVILEDNDGEFKAHWPKNNRVLFAESASTALDEMLILIEMHTKWASFKVTPSTDGDYSQVKVTVAGLRGFSITGAPSFCFAKAKAAWGDARSELSIEDQEGEEEVDEEVEEEASGRVSSVVAAKYRARYAEAGHPDHCGDWLANTLNSYCSNKAGFNLELFGLICSANGVDMSKYKLEKPSDRGRYRMTGRNMLARRVFNNEFLKLPDTIEDGRQIPAPREWLANQKFVKIAPVEAKPKTPIKE